jgi:hypothetical protein
LRWYEADGTEWTVCEGSHKFALTEEQLAQKALKRSKMRDVRIAKPNRCVVYFCVAVVSGHACATVPPSVR